MKGLYFLPRNDIVKQSRREIKQAFLYTTNNKKNQMLNPCEMGDMGEIEFRSQKTEFRIHTLRIRKISEMEY